MHVTPSSMITTLWQYGKVFFAIDFLLSSMLEVSRTWAQKLNTHFTCFRLHLGWRRRGRNVGGRRRTRRSPWARSVGPDGLARSRSRRRAPPRRPRSPSRRRTIANRSRSLRPRFRPHFRIPRRTFSERYSQNKKTSIFRTIFIQKLQKPGCISTYTSIKLVTEYCTQYTEHDW